MQRFRININNMAEVMSTNWASPGEASVSLSLSSLTHEVFHHGGVVMRRGSQAQQLLAAGHGGVVDGLHVDVVFLQHAVTHLCVQLGVAHLRRDRRKVNEDAKEGLFHPPSTLGMFASHG